MLKEFDDLIATLCANSSIMRKEQDGRLFFTIDGILFDSFWYSTDNYRFGTSERPSRVGATLRTPSSTVARYEGQVLWSGVIVLCPSGWVMR